MLVLQPFLQTMHLYAEGFQADAQFCRQAFTLGMRLAGIGIEELTLRRAEYPVFQRI